MAKTPPRQLANRVVAITGAARGIGRATARALVARGAEVAICDLDLATAEATAAELGGGTTASRLDVTDLPAYTRWLDEVEERLGPLDVLINNAGIMPLNPLDKEPDHITTKQLELNLHAVIHGTREAIQRMKPRGFGHIVNIASMAGKAGIPGGATYCATKFAVVGLTHSVHMELRGTGVSATVVMPGVVNTELASGLKDTKGVKKVEPEDVANAIVAALEQPTLEVFVPPVGGLIHKATYPLPRRFQEAVARLVKADQVLMQIDHGQRAAYEQRAAASAPRAEEKAEPTRELEPSA